MKRLAILRHAKSSWHDPQLSDFDRPLNERGWKAAKRIGRALNQRRARFDLVLASPALRVRETLEAVGVEAEIRFAGDMYLAGDQALLGIVRAIPDAVQSALMVGHNPGLQQLVVALARNDPEGFRKRLEQKLPTAALVQIDLPQDRWADVKIGTGTIAELIVPEELD